MMKIIGLSDTDLVGVKLFCSLCALMERVFYDHFLLVSSSRDFINDQMIYRIEDEFEKQNGKKMKLEEADFFDINGKSEEVLINKDLQQLFNFIIRERFD